MTYRIGIDIGGTFTDFVLHDGDRRSIALHKCLTTPHDPSVAALDGLGELLTQNGLSLRQIGEIVHGTTLVTNAIIERRGARIGLITTKGFRDILQMGTEQRYDIYDLFLKFPDPLVERRHRLEVPERIDAKGRIVVPLDLNAVARAVRQLVDAGAEAVAVCFLHAYRNAEHERAVRALTAREFAGLHVSLSSEVVGELREYQRCVTTCANAYVQPLMARYLGRLTGELAVRGFGGRLNLMHSAGGLISPAGAQAFPIRLLESGPAGGGLATALFGALAGKQDVIAFDMGGTTAKSCLVEGGRIEVASMMEAARVHRFKRGSGLPIKAPVIDMIETGAGGGSIAEIDEVGLLRVGPRSAGADPGPACYGRGGTEPTVTDANLALGYYDPDFFLGGRMALDRRAALKAVTRIGDAVGLSAIEAAWGIHKVVTENMAAAARIHIVEKGRDPRRYAMVGFGGAGPAHAAGVARILGIREVIVPQASGAASCLGFLAAPLSFEHARSHPVRLTDDIDAPAINRILDELEREGRGQLIEAGIAPADIAVERTADMRLVGQMHEINVALPCAAVDRASLATIRQAFAQAYAKQYATVHEGATMEQRVPVIVVEKAYIADSGGPGRHRGGLGQRVTLRKREPDGLPTLASVYPEGVGIESSGLFGGGAGRAARGVVRDSDGNIIRDCGTGDLVRLTSDREIVEVCLSGGSGFGDPRERPVEEVARDLTNGFVTAQGAEQDYGVAIGADGGLDVAATARRRQVGTAAE